MTAAGFVYFAWVKVRATTMRLTKAPVIAVLIVATAGSAGCGNHSLTAIGRTGGAGGGSAPDGGPGGTPFTEGSGGSANGGFGGSDLATGGATGLAGAAAPGGSAGGGYGGQPAASGGGGGGVVIDPCGSLSCTEGAVRCNGPAPQSCQRDTLGCTFWGTPADQPALCSANQICDATNGTCVCHDDPRCGTPPAGGDFCPTAGGATHATCNLAADGCFTVATGTPCAAGLVCETAVPGAVVPTGTACGCPQPLADQTGQTIALLGTACTPAQAAASARVGSAMDKAVLVCKPSGTCDTWQVFVACQSQQLTGGNDPVTSQPACVCPHVATGRYYVDPNPAMSTFMTGQPTGVQFPSACRFRTLTTALAQPDVTEVIAAHESSSNVHFKTLRGTSAVANCNAPNSCERFPMEIPAGVHVFTTDEGSFNPAHYVIDVDATGTKGYAVLLDDGAFLQGFTIDASATNSTGINAGARVAAVVTSPILGGWTGMAAAAPVTARLDQVLILGNATASNGTQTALLLQGQASWTASFLTIAGGAGTKRGIVIDHATDPIAGTRAALAASHLNVSVSGGTGQIAIELGSNGRDNGVAGVPGPAAADAGNLLMVTNDALLDGPGAPTPHRLNVGSAGVGLHLFHGTATLVGVDIVGGPQGFVGVQVDRSNAPAAAGLTLTGGSISGAGTTSGGVGVLVAGGFATLDGAHVTGADGWTGVVVRQSAGRATLAGDVTLTGSASAPTIIDMVTPLGLAAGPAGIQVGLGDEQSTFDVTAPPADVALPRLTIDDNTLVTHYVDGLVINNGHVVATGSNVQLTANLRDGLQVLSSLALAGTDPNDAAARAAFVGTSITGNGRAGVLLRDVVPVLLDRVTVSGNGTPAVGSALPAFPDGTGGIDVQRSQLGASGGAFPAVIVNSTVASNVGCGITLSGGGDDLVNRTGAGDGVRVCGLGTGFAIDGSPIGVAAGRVAGAQPGVRPGDVTTESPAPLGIFGGRTNVGGKVSAFIKNTHVQNNSGVGIYVTEARDFDPTLTTDDVTDVSLQSNLVTGNLMVVAPTGFEPVAGGIYFATSNLTSTDALGTRPVEVSDLGCEDPQDAAVDHAVCTRVRMSSFLGNTVSCNGRTQMAFGLPQRISTSASGVSPDGDWDISSDGTVVGLDLTMRCADAVSPNTLAGYSASAANIGLGVTNVATTPEGVSLVHVGAYGVKWNSGAIVAGGDYAPGLARPPQGNGDFANWGVCPDVMPVSCPIAPTAP